MAQFAGDRERSSIPMVVLVSSNSRIQDLESSAFLILDIDARWEDLQTPKICNSFHKFFQLRLPVHSFARLSSTAHPQPSMCDKIVVQRGRDGIKVKPRKGWKSSVGWNFGIFSDSVQRPGTWCRCSSSKAQEFIQQETIRVFGRRRPGTMTGQMSSWDDAELTWRKRRISRNAGPELFGEVVTSQVLGTTAYGARSNNYCSMSVMITRKASPFYGRRTAGTLHF
jgi:hypothetical protein